MSPFAKECSGDGKCPCRWGKRQYQPAGIIGTGCVHHSLCEHRRSPFEKKPRPKLSPEELEKRELQNALYGAFMTMSITELLTTIDKNGKSRFDVLFPTSSLLEFIQKKPWSVRRHLFLYHVEQGCEKIAAELLSSPDDMRVNRGRCIACGRRAMYTVGWRHNKCANEYRDCILSQYQRDKKLAAVVLEQTPMIVQRLPPGIIELFSTHIAEHRRRRPGEKRDDEHFSSDY